MGRLADLDRAYRARLKRRRLLGLALRHRHALSPVRDRTGEIGRETLLLFATIRNEAERLPYFLAHYRRLGIGHFLIVDNDSDDGSRALLARQPDVSLWRTEESYRASRFGMDWIGWLLMRYGHGHWCLTVDADELLLIPHAGERDLSDLTRWLDARNVPMMAATMLDLYPKGPLSSAHCPAGEDPSRALGWYDAWGYSWEYQPRFGNISVRGGPRKRAFFADHPDYAPHLHKVPLIRWNWRYAYVSSTHVALPPRLNKGLDPRLRLPTGILLHDKFLDQIIPKSRDEKLRREHFTHAGRYDSYYDALISDPVLWTETSCPLAGWETLERQGLMTRGDWI